MSFGRKILNKYGWKDGEGLGKDNNGIAEPIKAKLKFDTKGLGVNEAESDFNNHWWQRVFKEAANNLHVEQDEQGNLEVKLKSKDNEVEISTKSYSIKKLKRAKNKNRNSLDSNGSKSYDNFIASATLVSSNCEVRIPNKIDVGSIEYGEMKILTDEELFKACKGRTAHKAARHGLKQSGKLLRVEQQDKDLLAKLYKDSNDTASKEANLKKEKDDINCRKAKKKKKKIK